MTVWPEDALRYRTLSRWLRIREAEVWGRGDVKSSTGIGSGGWWGM